MFATQRYSIKIRRTKKTKTNAKLKKARGHIRTVGKNLSRKAVKISAHASKTVHTICNAYKLTYPGCDIGRQQSRIFHSFLFYRIGRIDFFSFFFSDVKHTHKFDVFRLITRKLLITMQPEHYRISNKTYEREEKKKNMNSNK